MHTGARKLRPGHVTIRVPWHDDGWRGTVCRAPLENSSCLVLPRIGAARRDDVEARCSGQRFDELSAAGNSSVWGGWVRFESGGGATRSTTFAAALGEEGIALGRSWGRSAAPACWTVYSGRRNRKGARIARERGRPFSMDLVDVVHASCDRHSSPMRDPKVTQQC